MGYNEDTLKEGTHQEKTNIKVLYIQVQKVT